MHATYSFLMYMNMKETELTADALKEAFDKKFSSSLDENNWLQHMAAVTDKGHVVSMCGEDDWRGREATQKGLLERPQAERWPWARDFALRCVAVEMNLKGYVSNLIGPTDSEASRWLDKASPTEVVSAICEEVPRRLSEGFTEMVGKEPEGWDMEKYRLFELSRHYMYFYSAMENKNVPFVESSSYGATPYTYRAFDLCWDSGKEGNVILLTDIHT